MVVALGIVRRRIAAALVPPRPVDAALGQITLQPGQCDAVRLVRDRLRRHRGCILADPVGTGKTYVAIACGREYPQMTIVAPAVLRERWREALRDAGVTAAVLSIESLQRRAPRPLPRDTLLVVDEAHHVRNPGTLRYRALARLAWGVDVLLLTATPVHNAARDVDALVGLFGAPGSSVDRAEVFLRRATLPAGLPGVSPVTWLPAPTSIALLDAIIDLPSPVPPDDAGSAIALGTLTLVRCWLSSHAALARAIERRLLAAHAMRALVAAGSTPTRAAVRRCLIGAEGLQFSLALELDGLPRSTTWCRHLERWIGALEHLRVLVAAEREGDAVRAAAVNDALATVPGVPAVVFSHATDTVRSLFAHLAPRRRAAAVWGNIARIASGRISRAEVLAAFRPGAAPPDDTMVLDLLVTTDVVSEGVDLQRAGVLVHLDLPWTPARLEQRVGRLRRPGSPHENILQFGFRLPPVAHRHVPVIRILCDKARVSRDVVGIDLPTPAPSRPVRGPGPEGTPLLRLAAQWTTASASAGRAPSPAVAAVRAPAIAGAWLATVATAESSWLVGRDHQGTSETPARLAALVLAANGPEGTHTSTAAATALRRARHWIRETHGLRQARPRMSRDQRTALRLIQQVTARVPRQGRSAAIALAERAAALVREAGSAGAREALSTWVATRPTALADLDALAAILGERMHPAPAPGTPEVTALLLFVAT